MPRPSEWRPRRFTDLVGRANALAVASLRAVARDRRPVAVGLFGPIGTGKTSCLRLLKRSFNCLRPDPATADPCWLCSNCLRCEPGYNAEWLTYWTYEIDATQKLDRAALSEVIDDAREAAPHAPALLAVDEFTRLDEMTAQPVFLKFAEDLGQNVFLAAAMTDERPAPAPLKVHRALLDRLDKYYFARPEADEVVGLLESLLPTWSIIAAPGALRELVLRTRPSFRECLKKLDSTQSLNEGRLDRRFLDMILPAAAPAAGSNLFADDSE